MADLQVHHCQPRAKACKLKLTMETPDIPTHDSPAAPSGLYFFHGEHQQRVPHPVLGRSTVMCTEGGQETVIPDNFEGCGIVQYCTYEDRCVLSRKLLDCCYMPAYVVR